MELSRSRKIYLLLSVVAVVAIFFLLSYRAEDNTDAEYDYEINEDGSGITVTAYSGSDSSLTVPDEIDGYTVTAVGRSAFENKTGLSKIELPDTVKTIGEYAFDNCSALSKVALGKSVESIGDCAFSSCESLTTIELPEGLLKIGDFAFYSCIRLSSVKIPASVEYIGTDAFAVCEKLTLDVSENDLAAAVAEQYSIPTDFKDSGDYKILIALLISLPLAGVAIAAVILLPKIVKRKQKNKKVEK